MVTQTHVVEGGKVAGQNVEEFLEKLAKEGYKREDPYDAETMAKYLSKDPKDHSKGKYAAVFSKPRQAGDVKPAMEKFLTGFQNVIGNLQGLVSRSIIFRRLFYGLLYLSALDVLRILLLTVYDLWPFDFHTPFNDPILALFTILILLPLYIFVYAYRVMCPLLVSYTLYKLVLH